MSVIFTLTGSSGTSVSFEHDEATDTGKMQPIVRIEFGSERSASGKIKQQIRNGKRFYKEYFMCLTTVKYIAFMNLFTDQSDDYFINFTTAPEILTNDPNVIISNDFAVALDPDEPESTVGSETIYRFNLKISSVDLL